jgi:hypothetical protein
MRQSPPRASARRLLVLTTLGGALSLGALGCKGRGDAGSEGPQPGDPVPGATSPGTAAPGSTGPSGTGPSGTGGAGTEEVLPQELPGASTRETDRPGPNERTDALVPEGQPRPQR